MTRRAANMLHIAGAAVTIPGAIAIAYALAHVAAVVIGAA